MKAVLRERLSKKTGKKTLYIEIYKGYNKTADGKIVHNRDYEYLDYYLFANPKNPVEKQHNKENLQAAKAVEAQRILEIQNATYGFANTHKIKTNFIEYFRKLTEDRKGSAGNYGNWDSTLKHLLDYANDSITFKDITTEFLEGFKDYLTNKAKLKSGKPLAENTISSYFTKLKAALNQAYSEKIINDNPALRVKGITPKETKREYLTMDEVKRLMNTGCRYDILKKAFLFSCFTGLRWSDVEKLTWGEIHEFEGGFRIDFRQKKTRGVEYLDIPLIATNFMGERNKNLAAKVFEGLKYSSYMNVALTQWMLKAGITKPITFHNARHSYATILLTTGDTDIYTISKLLGHKHLKTTQVYAKVIDQKKRDAVNIFDEMFK